MMKVCSNCSRPADYSLVSIISSVGISRRLQKSSPAVLFCANCLHKRMKREQWGTDKLRDAVNRAYTELSKRLRERSTETGSVVD
jgi:hypothetical protein